MTTLLTAPRPCWTVTCSVAQDRRPSLQARHRGQYRPHLVQCRPRAPLTCASSSASSTTAVAPDTTTPAERWEAFAAAAAGEWDGVTATFGPDGKPQPLPEYYVPQAFADWGVTLYDWQSQCSMRCDGEGLSYTHRRMMPTVGCEADAVAFTSQQQRLFPALAPGSPLAACGSYSHGPADLLAPDIQAAAIEQCLVLPGQQPAQRVRVVHTLMRGGADGAWRLTSIDVHRESWDSPYNGREELKSCGGQEQFAEGKPLDAGCLEGQWTASGGAELACDAAGGCSEASTSGRSWSLDSTVGTLTLLPLGLWASTQLEGDNVVVEVGVLLDDSTMRTASRRYTAGKLCSACLQTLVKH